MVSPYYEASYISIHRQSKGFPRVSSLLLRPSRALGFTEPSGIQVLTSRSTSVITALHSTPFSPDSDEVHCDGIPNPFRYFVWFDWYFDRRFDLGGLAYSASFDVFFNEFAHPEPVVSP